jgi:hypothetical protein
MKWKANFLSLHFGNGLELLLGHALATQGLCKKGEVTTKLKGINSSTNDNKWRLYIFQIAEGWMWTVVRWMHGWMDGWVMHGCGHWLFPVFVFFSCNYSYGVFFCLFSILWLPKFGDFFSSFFKNFFSNLH